MGSNKEIIAFQFGNYANFVATHFWNLQTCSFNFNTSKKETFFNKDVFFKEVKKENNESTFTPRCIISDLKDNMDFDNMTHMDTLKQETLEVKKWNNFLTPCLHPKSIQILDHYQLNNEKHDFAYYGQGKEVYEISKDDYDNKIHFFSEDCDYLQGFNIFCDTFNAFGGILNGLFDDIISNDFKNKSILIYSVRPPFLEKNKFALQLICLNTLISYCQILNHKAYIIPISVSRSLYNEDFYQQNLITYDAYSQYESSSILASAIYNNSLPLALINKPCTLYDMLYPLSSSRNNIFSLNCCLPFNNHKDWINSIQNSEIRSLSAPSVDNYHTIPQHVCISGLKELNTDIPITFVEKKIKFMEPFPKIFKNNKYDSKLKFEEYGMYTSLQSNSNVCNYLIEILKECEFFKKNKDFILLSRLQLEEDELVHHIEQFNQIISNYYE